MIAALVGNIKAPLYNDNRTHCTHVHSLIEDIDVSGDLIAIRPSASDIHDAFIMADGIYRNTQ